MTIVMQKIFFHAIKLINLKIKTQILNFTLPKSEGRGRKFGLPYPLQTWICFIVLNARFLALQYRKWCSNGGDILLNNPNSVKAKCELSG